LEHHQVGEKRRTEEKKSLNPTVKENEILPSGPSGRWVVSISQLNAKKAEMAAKGIGPAGVGSIRRFLEFIMAPALGESGETYSKRNV